MLRGNQRPYLPRAVRLARAEVGQRLHPHLRLHVPEACAALQYAQVVVRGHVRGEHLLLGKGAGGDVNAPRNVQASLAHSRLVTS